MLRKEIEAVPQGNGPVFQQEKFGSGQPTWEELQRVLKEKWDRQIDEMIRLLKQQSASQEQDARQPRLAVEEGGLANTKTRKRMEGATTAVKAMHRDNCSATRVKPGPNTNSTCFGVMAEPPDIPFRDDVLVENGAASPKSCRPPLEMRTTTAAGGLLPTGKTSTATMITFNETPLQFYSTEETNPKETNLWTSVPSDWYDRSFWRNKLLAAPSRQRAIETKSMQNKTLDPGDSQGRLRACPFLGSWRALLCGEVIRVGVAG